MRLDRMNLLANQNFYFEWIGALPVATEKRMINTVVSEAIFAEFRLTDTDVIGTVTAKI